MGAKKLTSVEVDARLVAYNEAIDHLYTRDAFETAAERKQAEIIAASLATQRDKFIKKYSDRE